MIYKANVLEWKNINAAKGQTTQSIHFTLKQDKQWQTFKPGHRKELFDHIKAEVLKWGVSPHLLSHFLFEVSLVYHNKPNCNWTIWLFKKVTYTLMYILSQSIKNNIKQLHNSHGHALCIRPDYNYGTSFISLLYFKAYYSIFRQYSI